MASTYSPLKLQLMATGENLATWGNVTNVNLGTALEEMVTGSADVTFSSGNVTLSLTNTNASQAARNLRLNLVGTTGGARDLVVPAVEKIYVVNNGCADTVTVKNSTGTGIAVPAGKTMWVYNDATNVVDVVSHLSSLTLVTALPVASGGTGSTSVSDARTALGVPSLTGSGASGTWNISITGTAAPAAVPNALTMNSGGSGAASGTTFDGSTARTISYNTIGAPSTSGTGASGTWGISISGNAATATSATTATTATNLSGGSVAATTITATGNITAFVSDDRLKTREGYLENALDKICSLTGFYYRMNQTALVFGLTDERRIGLSAQDVQRIAPEAIRPAPINADYMTFQPDQLLPFIVEAIKELREEIRRK